MTESQFITKEMADEAAAAHAASAAVPPRPSNSPPASAAATSAPSASAAVSAASSEGSAAVADTAAAALHSYDAHTDSSWQAAIQNVLQDKCRAAPTAAEKIDSPQPPQQHAVEHKVDAEEKKEVKSQPEVSPPAAAAVIPAGHIATAPSSSDSSVVPSDPAGTPPPSSSLYSRLTSLLTSFSSSPVLPSALLFISLLGVGFYLGRSYERHRTTVAQQRYNDAVHAILAKPQRRAPAYGGGSGGGGGGGGGLYESTRRLVSTLISEQEKEIGRWLGVAQGESLLMPVILRYIQ